MRRGRHVPQTKKKGLVAKTGDALDTHGNPLAIALTGARKTIMLSAVRGRMLERDRERACVLAHRDELTFHNEGTGKRATPSLATSMLNANGKSWEGPEEMPL